MRHAVQEALLAAATQWPADGVPDNPRGWLIAVANRRLIDHIRSESARRRREDATAAATPIDDHQVPAADAERDVERDDTLALLFLCCHPALSTPSQVALTLRAVGGLTTVEVARAFPRPRGDDGAADQPGETARPRRRSRFALPPEPERAERLRVVLHVLYLVFNEGYTASAGQRLHRGELTREAIRLTRTLHRRCCPTTARSPACSP